MRRRPTPAQRRGTEFGGVQQQNTLQPVERTEDLKPHEQARLIKTTGQDSDPSAMARTRHWHGQTGEQPRTNEWGEPL